MVLTIAIAVIAGAGPGLGFSLAKKFSQEYHVILLSRTQSRLDEFASKIVENGGQATGIATDLNDEQAVAQAPPPFPSSQLVVH